MRGDSFGQSQEPHVGCPPKPDVHLCRLSSAYAHRAPRMRVVLDVFRMLRKLRPRVSAGPCMTAWLLPSSLKPLFLSLCLPHGEQVPPARPAAPLPPGRGGARLCYPPSPRGVRASFSSPRFLTASPHAPLLVCPLCPAASAGQPGLKPESPQVREKCERASFGNQRKQRP